METLLPAALLALLLAPVAACSAEVRGPGTASDPDDGSNNAAVAP